MNPQNDKEGSVHIKAATIIGGFSLLAACVGGLFLLLNTMVNNGIIVFGASNPSVQPTTPASQYQEQSNTPTSVQEVMWQDLGVFYGEGNTRIGNPDKWMVFQVWDGINTSTTVHGVIEPGWFLIIPAPIQGSTWMISGYSNY